MFKISIKQKQYLIITLSSLLFTAGMQLFVTLTQTFSAGLGAFAALITYVAPIFSSYFSIVYLVINIPLLIWSWRYNNKKFTIRTIYFLFLQTLLGLPFIFIDAQDIVAKEIWLQKGTSELRNLIWPLIILPILGAILVGTSTGLAWKGGASTAGIDVITYYFSTKKKLSIGLITKLLALGIVTIAITITISTDTNARRLALPTTVGTLLFIYTNSRMIDIIFPKYSKIEVNIYTENPNRIVKQLKANKFNHSFNLINVKTGMGSNKTLITTTILLLELSKLRKLINASDKEAWIKTTSSNHVYGKFNTDSVDTI